MVVDDAIIDVENVVRRLREARATGSGASTFNVVLNASVEVRSAITYAHLDQRHRRGAGVVPGRTVRIVLPAAGALLRAGSAGARCSSRSTVTPALCLILLSRGKLVEQGVAADAGAEARVRRTCSTPLIRRPLPAIAMTPAAVALARGLAVPTLGSQLLPNFKERDFLMHWLTQPGTSVAEETRISVSACKDLREIPGVRNCGSHIGQAYLADEVYGVDFGENWISVSPERRLRQDPGRGAQGRSSTTRASTATCRPTSGSASRRC